MCWMFFKKTFSKIQPSCKVKYQQFFSKNKVTQRVTLIAEEEEEEEKEEESQRQQLQKKSQDSDSYKDIYLEWV